MNRDGEQQKDAQLVAAALKKPDDFVHLVRRFEAPLGRYLARLVRTDEDEQRILLQNVFIKVYQNLNGIDTSLPLSSWLYRIAHNEAIDYFRRRFREAIPDSATEHTDEDGDTQSALDRIADEMDIVSSLDKERARAIISSILDTMPPKYKDVLVLRFFEAKDYTEIADIIKRPLGTVSILLHRAKKEFRKKAALRGVSINEL